jgi:hypothetical protein
MAIKRVIYRDGVIIKTETFDADWNEIKSRRAGALEKTDLWMLSDRFDNLTAEKQTELKAYRQAWRDLPTTYPDANDAYDNLPTEPSWI